MEPNVFREILVSPVAFREHLLIDTDDGPRPLAETADDWQLADFRSLDPGWRRVAGLPTDNGCNRAYLERGGVSSFVDSLTACYGID